MRHLTYSLLTLILFINISCSDDNKYIEDLTDTTSLDADETKNEVPCAIDFSSVVANDVVLIGCDLDLNGETITLPEHVTLKFDGGSITNGTLQFNGGLIDGELLNLNLEIEGSARLIDTGFTFNHTKWDIIEGEVSDEVALSNRVNINTAITQVKSLRGYAFIIDNIDAYVQITASAYGNTAHREAIRMPSDFHFKMGDNCHLRVQPHALPSGAILSARLESNVKISGGHLYGDKFEHIYTQGIPYKMHDSAFGVYFIAVQNGIVDGVEMKNFTGDGFNLHSIGLRNNDGTIPAGKEHNFSDNIVVRNCIFDANRRNNLSIIDGENIIIENNLFLKAGESDQDDLQGTTDTVYTWRGVIPGNGIDFEAWSTASPTANTHKQYINNVIVRNNIFRNGHRGDLNLFSCSNVEVYGNEFDSGLSNKKTYNIKIHDNTFTRNPNYFHPTGITIKQFILSGSGEDINVNHEIYNNTISGYDNGIFLGGTSQKVYNNTITNFSKNGIYLGNGANNQFYDNVINSTIDGSKGYFNYPVGIELINTTISNETINVKNYGMLLLNVGGGENLIFNDCNFQGDFRNVDIRNSNDITIINSQTGIVYQTNNSNITLDNNN